MFKRTLLSMLMALGLLFVGLPGQALSKDKVVIFHAGSLAVPMQTMEKNFEAMHPDIDVQREVGGSTKMARLISEVGKPADIMASADYKVIDNNLIPDFADWNVRFATNQLVLTYTADSRYADEINEDNWFEVLQKKDVEWGHSDPNLDPCGYRALMVLQLAEEFYGIDNLYADLLANRDEKNVRPKSVELINLLKSGNMDYAWEYLSVAVQHDMEYLRLDEHINLGNYKFDDFYKTAEVEVSGKEPGTMIIKRGKSCTYGLTQIKDSAHPKAAVKFLEYLLDPQSGLAILKDMGQPPFIPARVPTQEMLDALPDGVRPLVEVKQ